VTTALAQLVLLAMVCFAGLGATITAVLYPMARTQLANRTPAERSRWGLLWIGLPAILALSLTAVCVLPSLGSLLEAGSHDHCLRHPDEHLHLCLVHPPEGAGSAAGWIFLAAVGVLLASSTLRVARSLITARRTLTVLLRGTGRSARLEVTWLRCTLPIAATVGLLRPRIVVSEALRAALPPHLLDAVIAHERAHVRRRDVARRTGATLLGLLHLPSVRRLLLDDFVAATELAADATAATEVRGGSLCVADAILAVQRLAGDVRPAPLAVAFGETSVRARIEALLGPAAIERRRHRVASAVAGAAIAVLAAPLLHHTIETVLSILVG
jgi:Zn-dependent protease with chaperone function